MTQSVEWLGHDTPGDVQLIDAAPGGALSDAGRQAAVEASLSLLGVYFAAGDVDSSDMAAAASGDDAEMNELRAGLRLRVAIAAARRLLSVIDEVTKRPTFRYELRSTEHVGSLSGALDFNRWLTQPRGGDQDLTFPVLEVTRGLRTPENVLLTYAVGWLIRELRVSLRSSLATPEAVEYRLARQHLDRLERARQLPGFAGCRRSADAIRTSGAIYRLIADVRRRLRRREIWSLAPYLGLVEWIERCLDSAPAANAGEIDISVYGERFDNKLFELWCLGVVARGLADELHLPEPAVHRAWRRTTAAYTFEVFSGKLELHFQRGLSALDARHRARWNKENGARLGGVPDIVVRAVPTLGDPLFAVVDPKLRQRDRLPSEELYKILGYMQNFGIRPAVGGVLIYTTSPESTTADLFRDGEGGTLFSIALNPAAPQEATDVAIRPLLEILLALIGQQLPGDRGTNDEEVDDDWQAERTVREVQASIGSWGQSHLAEITPSRERIKALVGDVRWGALSDDVRVMMATADLVGHQLDPSADFSGPVIGMCAAVEHVVHSIALDPVVGSSSDWQRQTRTFGGALDVVDLACRDRGGELPRAVRARLLSTAIDLEALNALDPVLRQLNKKFRVPAAHRQVLTKSDWQSLYRLVMGSEMLFIRTHDALAPISTGSD